MFDVALAAKGKTPPPACKLSAHCEQVERTCWFTN
jgi:hypothetical protein